MFVYNSFFDVLFIFFSLLLVYYIYTIFLDNIFCWHYVNLLRGLS